MTGSRTCAAAVVGAILSTSMSLCSPSLLQQTQLRQHDNNHNCHYVQFYCSYQYFGYSCNECWYFNFHCLFCTRNILSITTTTAAINSNAAIFPSVAFRPSRSIFEQIAASIRSSYHYVDFHVRLSPSCLCWSQLLRFPAHRYRAQPHFWLS